MDACTSSSIGQENITPIHDIKPYMNNSWRIHGLCTEKEPLKKIQPAHGETDMFVFTLTDDNGDAIRVVAYGEVAVKANGIVQMDVPYFVSKGSIKQANKKFNPTKHEFEIQLNKASEITPSTNANIRLPSILLNICPLDKVSEHKDETVDVLAIVDKILPISEYVSSAGRNVTKREVSLIDRNGTVILLTLWNDQARQFDEHALGQVIGIKGASVREWNGSFSLSSVTGTKWELSPNLPEVPELYEWYRDQRPVVETKSLTRSPQAKTLVTLEALTGYQFENEPNGRFFTVKAMIRTIKADTALYKACAGENCQKKVVEMHSQYRCETCDTTRSDYKWRYMVSMELTDETTGKIWATAFEKAAEQLFEKTSQQMGELRENKTEEYERLFDEVRSKDYVFRIRAKPETYNDETRIRYQIFEILKAN